jgi:exosortase H (IPTLxxWG-CTERM-specific)
MGSGRGYPRRSVSDRIGQWFAEHRGVFVFLLIFSVLMAGFYALIGFTPFYNYRILPAYHQFIAEASAKTLSFLGERTTTAGAVVFSPRFSVQIISACDAIEVSGLFACAVLAFPVGLSRKFVGIAAGVFAIAILNLVRVVSLFLIGVHLPDIFSVMHIDVWQSIFVVVAVALWVVWLGWVVNSEHQRARVSAE